MAKKGELKRINLLDRQARKKNQEVTKYDFLICPNCGETEVGKYCPNCGQSNKDFNKPVKEIIGDLFDSINLDIRLLNTLIPFFTKPGFLTEEYFKGRRKRYVPPMRMYILFSVLFFFLAQVVGLEAFTTMDNADVDSADSTQQNTSWSFEISNDDVNLTLDNKSNQHVTDSSDINEIITLDNLTQDNVENLKQELLSDSTTTELAKGAIAGGFNVYENKELVYTKFLKYSSYSLFFLMPIFALILFTILWKSKMMYIKHLIFSINFHSFIFGLSSIVMALSFVVPGKLYSYTSYLWWGIPLYLFFGIKRFYKRKYIGSFFKTIGALSLYFLIISIVVIVILVITFKDFMPN